MHPQIECRTDYTLRGYSLCIFAVFLAQSPPNPEKSIWVTTNSYTNTLFCRERCQGAGSLPCAYTAGEGSRDGCGRLDHPMICFFWHLLSRTGQQETLAGKAPCSVRQSWRITCHKNKDSSHPPLTRTQFMPQSWSLQPFQNLIFCSTHFISPWYCTTSCRHPVL